MTAPPLDYQIRQIEPGDKVTGLSLGDETYVPLKTFLKRDAVKYHERHLARTYVAIVPQHGNKIAGYVTLICGEVSAHAASELPRIENVSYAYSTYPAVKIARLAVDRGFRGSEIGRTLVALSLGIAKNNICPMVGCRFVVVDAKQGAVNFYLKVGFKLLDTAENRAAESPFMFLDLWKT